MFKRLWKSKTFWTGLAALGAAAQQYATGEATLTQAITIASTALLAIFLRDGQAKGAAK